MPTKRARKPKQVYYGYTRKYPDGETFEIFDIDKGYLASLRIEDIEEGLDVSEIGEMEISFYGTPV
jgi:hypothetical protein